MIDPDAYMLENKKELTWIGHLKKNQEEFDQRVKEYIIWLRTHANLVQSEQGSLYTQMMLRAIADDFEDL